jgi:pullulanase/glycogen debranching enzyme
VLVKRTEIGRGRRVAILVAVVFAVVRIGVPLPMGTREYGGGVNFAIFSRHATRVRLELFDHPMDAKSVRAIDLDPARNRTVVAYPVLSKDQFYADEDILWFGPRGGLPNWVDPQERQLACLIRENEQHSLFLMFNAGKDGVDFHLPPQHSLARWYLAVDTAQATPQDLSAADEEPLLEGSRVYRLGAHSSAILLLRGANQQQGQTAIEEAA